MHLTTTSNDLYHVFNLIFMSKVLYKCVAHPFSTIFTLVNVQETNNTGEHSFTIRLVMQHTAYAPIPSQVLFPIREVQSNKMQSEQVIQQNGQDQMKKIFRRKNKKFEQEKSQNHMDIMYSFLSQHYLLLLSGKQGIMRSINRYPSHKQFTSLTGIPYVIRYGVYRQTSILDQISLLLPFGFMHTKDQKKQEHWEI